ncbi:hypothetical protein JWG45_13420 [Leptospira sp. 201903070]|jgi:hypothetical protein|uniref:DUF3995 domain-containing protein n=1 Tax=Leptospira ainlahdjerensis TaxID=2810033 RepID=A0ABS2UCQ4_9LEPT|nr:hypothetical protein [Leptospira ainlahdjerensis]MBM9578151.1 hypothetical protein [Leptospira ainlahdjerensis]
MIKKIHYFSGITLALFIGFHLFNHFASFWGPEVHRFVMEKLRFVYRNPFVETLILLAVLTQIVSGIRLFIRKRKKNLETFDRVQIATGLYLVLFLVIHLSAVLAGRFILRLDTNFYFGAAGLNTFPFSIFFIPYYSLAVISVFGHLAAAHRNKMKLTVLGVSPVQQSVWILILGIILAGILIYGLTNRFQQFQIPKEYKILTGN